MKIKQLFLAVLLVASATMAMAKPVDPSAARRVAQRILGEGLRMEPLMGMYLFTPLEGEGFVLVSGDDCVRPVLAYSRKGAFPVDDMPQHLRHWLEGYDREIASFVEAGATPSAEVQAMWQNAKSARVQPVEPLVTTTWNQRPWYNDMCPYSWTDSARAVTGCVATAQAQIMKYWNHPAKGHGSHNYNSDVFGPLSVTFDTLYQWNDMSDALYWGSSETERHAVAQLMYHVGVAVEMNYGVGSSGAYVTAYGPYNLPSSERSLQEHFRYSPLLSAVWKSGFSDADWDSLMRNELVHGRPVLYSGRDASGGHAFVLDGCDTMGFFHINWGWGGSYDGYYTTDSLSPGAGGVGGNATYTFNIDNAALIGIMPAYGNDSVACVNAVSADPSMGTVTGNGTYVPYVDHVEIRAVAAEGYRFAGWKSGLAVNPVSMLINGDFTDTALFVPLGRDTLSYAADQCYTAWHDDYGTNTSWGIRIPASRRNALRSLGAVQLYVRVPGFYTMSVYCGDSIDASSMVHTGQYDLTEAYGWTAIDLAEPLPLLGDQPLYITFSFTSDFDTYPAAASYYTGISDGTWYKLPQGWRPFDQNGQHLTWMIRALFVERPCHVDVVNAGYCELDSLFGSGFYALGDTVTIGCTDNLFTHWEGLGAIGNTLTFVASGDTVFRAYCREVGVDQVDAGQPLSVWQEGLTVVAQSPTGETLHLFDIQGRLLASAVGSLRCRVPAAGVYILRAATRPARKVVVME